MKKATYVINRNESLTSPIRALIPVDTYFSLRSLQFKLVVKK